MNEIAVKDVLNIDNMIYEIDGKEVMLDSDLAKLYNVETKRINEAVKNNPKKFPARFSWLLSVEETSELSRSKISTLNIKQGTNIKYGARVFTEQGVYMLATILKSKTATEVSIRIMDTFVKMRHYINFNKNILPRRFLLLEDKVDENTKRIDELFDKFNPKIITKNSIFFKGDIYDAYSVLIEIINLAKEEIIIISSNIDETLKNKYLKQYNNIKFIKNSSYHDRFIIIDRNIVYHCGASFKDLGKKCFSIHEINDKEYVKTILKNINIT